MNKIRHFALFAIILSGAACFPGMATAQNPSDYYIDDPRTFYGGLLLGTNLSQVDGDSYAGYHKAGLNVGGIVYAHLAEKLAASLEILFSQKGSRGHKEQISGAANLITRYRIDLNYAEIPLQINYFDRRKSHFGGGLSYSHLISSKEVIETNPPDPNIVSMNFPFRKSDLNFVLGGNLHLIKGLFLNLRFQYSLISIRKDIPPGYGRAEQFNNMWTVRLMYLF